MATPRKTAAGTWTIQIEIAGVRKSATKPTARAAREWANQQTLELSAAKAGQLGSIKTLRDAMRRYALEVSSTKRGHRAETIRLTAFEGDAHKPLPIDKLLEKVTPADLIAWRDARLALTARGSVLRDMTLLGSVLETARRDWNWVRSNPIRDVRRPQEPDHRQRIISASEIAAMCTTLGYDGGPIRTVSQSVAVCFLLALETGMRAGELCGLKWADVHSNFAVLHQTKSGKRREVPLTAEAVQLVEKMLGWDDVSLFALTPQTLDALFRRARNRAGLQGFTFHDSRHTAATKLAQRLHVLDLCKMFGWANTSQALTYFNPTGAELARRLAS